MKKIYKILLYIYLFSLVSMFSGWAVLHIQEGGMKIPHELADLVINFAQVPSKAFHFIKEGVFFKDDRKILNSIDNILINKDLSSKKRNDYSFLISTIAIGDSLEIKLVSGHNLQVKKRWLLSEEFVLKNKNLRYQDHPVRLSHPILLSDSSLIFSYSSLYRIAKDNNVKWINNSKEFHHAIEMDGDSLVWTGSRIYGNKYFNFHNDSLENDGICAIDVNTGVAKYEKSIADILVENGYMYLLQLGKHEPDLIHLNDIQPVSKVGKFWKQGDLFVSIRHRNTVFLYRPSTNKILWLKTGPWMAQHDVDIVDDKTIMIFGNDVLRGKENHFFNGHNEIYFYDFEKDSVYRPYTEMMRKLNIRTIFEGRSDLLPNGDLFIDETNNGKLYVITKDSLKMKYVERIDDKHIKMFNWVRPVFN